jgi:hypothetical protein
MTVAVATLWFSLKTGRWPEVKPAVENSVAAARAAHATAA